MALYHEQIVRTHLLFQLRHVFSFLVFVYFLIWPRLSRAAAMAAAAAAVAVKGGVSMTGFGRFFSLFQPIVWFSRSLISPFAGMMALLAWRFLVFPASHFSSFRAIFSR